MRSARRVGRSQRVELPLAGLKVTEIRFGRGRVVLVFGERYDTELQIEEAIRLCRGTAERVLTGSRPGATFNVAELGPVLELYGLTVLDAVAFKDGSLRVRFQGELVLDLRPSCGYEAWHFRSPRLHLDGSHGRLI